MVGKALAASPTPLPWHRVINTRGELSLAPDSEAGREQKRRLLAEGVQFCGARIDLRRYGWRRSDSPLLD